MTGVNFNAHKTVTSLKTDTGDFNVVTRDETDKKSTNLLLNKVLKEAKEEMKPIDPNKEREITPKSLTENEPVTTEVNKKEEVKEEGDAGDGPALDIFAEEVEHEDVSSDDEDSVSEERKSNSDEKKEVSSTKEQNEPKQVEPKKQETETIKNEPQNSQKSKLSEMFTLQAGGKTISVQVKKILIADAVTFLDPKIKKDPEMVSVTDKHISVKQNNLESKDPQKKYLNTVFFPKAKREETIRYHIMNAPEGTEHEFFELDDKEFESLKEEVTVLIAEAKHEKEKAETLKQVRQTPINVDRGDYKKGRLRKEPLKVQLDKSKSPLAAENKSAVEAKEDLEKDLKAYEKERTLQKKEAQRLGKINKIEDEVMAKEILKQDAFHGEMSSRLIKEKRASPKARA